MTKFYKRMLLPLFVVLVGAASAIAQSTVAGKIKDTNGDPMAGVNVVVKGTVTGTISDGSGDFSLKISQAPPYTLSFSFVGYKTQEIEVTDANKTDLTITIEEQTLLGQEVVVAASRVEESILKSPVTIEKMDLLTIRQSATPDFYDGLANIKGVQTNSGSLNLTSVNTRGFATIANVRFVQWVDGMDTQAPLLNFPTGNIIGIGELDVENVELVPGAASALYGPNAFNGILLMNSKSPFLYQGLSAQVKQGITKSDAGGTHPMGQYSIRYAKAFNNKIAFKLNFAYQMATDWLGNDYRTSRVNPESKTDLSGTPNFDGLNLYGDEPVIPVPIGGTFGTLDLRRTGFKEENMLKAFSDNRDANSIKADGALHYRITDNIEALYNYRFGGGSSIYQGTEKYVLRNFTQQFHKLEVKGENFFVRAYQTATDAGDSYNLSALGAYANETYSPTATKWAPEYAQTYVLAMQGYVNGVPAGNPAAANAAARAYADRDRPAEGTEAYDALMQQVRKQVFQGTPPGASFSDNSKLRHAEFNYKFFNQIKWAEIQVGGNVRQYDLFTKGTVFNEDPEDGTNFKRIKINEFGVYTQVAKTIADALKITGSLRYDKNQNFDGFVTPRISAVYSLPGDHNIRASFQTGFRNPDTQAQYIYFPSSSGILLGSVKDNAERYGVLNGGAYTQASYNDYRASGGTINATTGAPTGGNSALLQTADIPYVTPEKLKSFEVGYKGLIATKLLIDLNGYYTSYQNFIGSQIIVSKNATTHQGKAVAAGTLYSPYVNSTENVTSYGVGVGLSYSLPRNFVLSGNYSYATFDANESPEFRAGFNTPQNKYNVGISNRKVTKNLGFNVNFRWQEEYLWQSSYGEWNVPAYGVVDAQVSYKLSPIKTMIKIGGTNIGGGDYRTNLGSPFIGQQYYVSLTFDEFLK
ncbi:MAG: TonB-dependent receptor [Azospira oryzae]|jgi:iron complex outermembrane receptor protein|nr:MAG: TonB-dependent receptor [Azospira oryzae]